MACLDTDCLIDLARNDEKAIAKVAELSDSGELLFTTIINVAEYYAGTFRSKTRGAVESARDYLRQFSILVLDEDSVLLWGRLYSELKSSAIGDRDLFIACIALANKQTLLTRNKKHFERVPGLQVEGW
ncbi:putative nucleic acid-binding protein, contains PIN domain [Candidatus Nitrososphaera evergladensis SR1]|uniref:Ribonuclease VapC n=1 Tax=Candidatus Nitrososphaera evergladensis SR1 TaxID=1459636 RepID=A0A075MWL9_9ARCH|nr:type II toxin-antitoxin system VapC family toxin [Candidatus Nitrososphaera evergladensis]AIF83664.1 putative nucleic acid-binding protein, contains PIN domain [Candidatus Nitrososphaera evergladensis SR1]